MTRPWTTAVNKTPGRLERAARDECLLDDVEDAVDDQPDVPALHQNRRRPGSDRDASSVGMRSHS